MASVASLSWVLNPEDEDMSRISQRIAAAASCSPTTQQAQLPLPPTSASQHTRPIPAASPNTIRPRGPPTSDTSPISSTLQGHITKFRATKRAEHKAQEQARRERLKLALEKLDSLMTERRLSDASSTTSTNSSPTSTREDNDSPSSPSSPPAATRTGRGGAFANMYIKAATVERAIEYIAGLRMELDRAQGRIEELNNGGRR